MMAQHKPQNRQARRAVSGWLNFDKENNISSAQAVGKLRRIFAAQKIGHAGTLDPLASGVLPIALGEATKTVSYMVTAQKEYEFTVQWGVATDTDDGAGAVIERSDRRPTEAEIKAVLPRFTGLIDQAPPVFSALKIDGERAYMRARRGEKLTPKPRKVEISALKYQASPDANHAQFAITCGKGTYVRALARDLGAALGSLAHVTALRRTRVGSFLQKDAITLAKCMDLGHIAADMNTPMRQAQDFAALDGLLLPVQTVLDDIPALLVTEKEARDIRQGRSVAICAEAVQNKNGAIIALFENQAVAMGRVNEGRFCPSRVFNLEPL